MQPDMGARGSRWAQRDQAPQLGHVAATRQARRLKHAVKRLKTATAGSDSAAVLQLRTPDASLCFVVRCHANGLAVERRQRRPLHTHVVQWMLFADAAQFKRWCEAEPMRFEDPHLHQRLCRCGEEYFGAVH